PRAPSRRGAYGSHTTASVGPPLVGSAVKATAPWRLPLGTPKPRNVLPGPAGLGTATIVASGGRACVLRPEVPDQVREAVERRPAIDPALAAAPAAADYGHMTQLGQPRERVPEGDHGVALGLVHLAEEEAGLELAPHALRERALRDRPLLLRGQRAREQRGNEEEVDRVVLVEVEVEPLGDRHVQDDAARVHEPLDQPAPLEPAEALAEVRPIVALERGRDPRPLGVQQPGERARRSEELAHAAGGARRAE